MLAVSAVLLLAALAVVTPTGAGTRSTFPTIQPEPDPAPFGIQRCRYTVGRVKAHRSLVWELQARLGVRRTPISRSQKIRSCGYARWVERLWWQRVVSLRREARWRILPEAHDWSVAVDVTQRVFPGSKGWLLSCSASEGGHGGFVWNHQGSGAGGWLQFLRGTFERHVDDAISIAKHRGFRLPASTRSYYSPLGQSLTGGYMWNRGWTGQWYGSGC